MKYSFRRSQIFPLVATNINVVRPWEGDARHRSPTSQEKGEEGSAAVGVRFKCSCHNMVECHSGHTINKFCNLEYLAFEMAYKHQHNV
jgi:hypothetical protein